MRSIYLFVCSFLCVLYLSVLNGQNDTQSITIRQDSSTVRAEVLIDDSGVNHLLDRTYYGYYQNAIRTNQGGHVGRLLHGDFQEIGEKGNLLEQGQFDFGLKEGTWTKWYPEGGLEVTYSYQNGKKEGLFREYDQSGTVYRLGYYYRDELHGKITYHPDTESERIEKYKEGVLQEETVARRGKKEKDRPQKARRERPAREKSVVAQKEPPSPRTRKRRRRNVELVNEVTQTSTDRAALPPEVATQLSRMPPRSVAVFIVQGPEEEPLVSASVKVVGYKNGQSTSESFSGFTGSDGVYYLRRDSADYVLTINHPNYEKAVLRINRHDLRQSYLLKVRTTIDCGQVAGTVQRTKLSAGLVGVQVEILGSANEVITKAFTEKDGSFSVCLPCSSKYKVRLSRSGYSNTVMEFNTITNCKEEIAKPIFYLEKKQSRPEPSQSIVRDEVSSNPSILSTTENVPTPSTGQIVVPTPSREPFIANSMGEGPRFAIVAGSFSDSRNAEKRKIQIEELGYTGAFVDFQENTQTYAVIVAQADDEAAANKLMRDFRRKTRLKAFIRDAQKTN